MMRSLYLMGVDGSGKSTLAENLNRALGNQATHVLYAQHRPFLLAPVRWVVRRTMLRGESEYAGYEGYRMAKQRATKRFGFATAIYMALWFLDYIVTTWPRVLWAQFRCGKRLLIVDRYYLDQAVNMAVTLGRHELAGRIARVFEAILPTPSHGVFLKVSDDVAYARKDDIQSVEFLRERQSLYEKVAGERGFGVIDADGPPQAVCADVMAFLRCGVCVDEG